MKTTSFSRGSYLDTGDERAFFISANGYDGFRSRHELLYHSKDFTRVFVILGGPGTGKSSLMRRIAEVGLECNASCEYIYCSSDPLSLDGIILEKGEQKIAVLDGTAPHVRAAHVPGAIDEILHLGECWDAVLLSSERNRILALQEAGGDAYARARRYLSLAGEASRALYREQEKILDMKKLRAAVERELRGARVSNTPSETVRYRTACGTNGIVHLNTFMRDAEVILVSDECGAGHQYLNAMREHLRAEGVHEWWHFPSCFDDEITEGIYLPKNKRLYLIDNGEKNQKKINIKRFVIKEREVVCRRHIRTLLHLREQMLEAACLSLSHAGTFHFLLEEIYGRAMDFGKKEGMTEALAERIRGMLGGSKRD